MKRPVYLLLIVVGLLTIRCDSREIKYTYPCDKSISDPSGNPKDSIANFFPTSLQYNDSLINIDVGTWYSRTLHVGKEKILYNCYLGQDTYRFSWFRSFDEPVFISINKKEDEYWLTVKKLSKPFVKYHEGIEFLPADTYESDKKAGQDQYNRMMDTLRLPPKIVTNEHLIITKTDWDNFEQELKKCNY